MKYINFKIWALEPLKMGNQNLSEDTSHALNYIAGSSIRGAVIHSYIRTFNADLEQDRQLKIDLLKKLHFLNAYPAAYNKRSVPSPSCFFAGKKALAKHGGEKIEVSNVFEKERLPQGHKVCKKEPFAVFKDKKIYGVKVKKLFNLHINVRKEKMFRYEAIAKNQEFHGSIAVYTDDSSLVEQIEGLLDNQIMYFGGSKGSGYGKCSINCRGVADDNPEEFENHDLGEIILVYYMSDAILRQSDGTIGSTIDTGFLAGKLGAAEVNYLDGTVDTVLITGYNSVWDASLPQYEAIKAGSVQRYEVKGVRDIDVMREGVKELENSGVGDRKQDGFGRIQIIDGLHYDSWEEYRHENKSAKMPDVSNETKEQLRNMLQVLYRNKLLRGMDSLVVEQTRDIYVKLLNEAQAGKIIELSVQAQSMNVREGKEKLDNYFKHMQGRVNNQKYIRQFRDSKIAGQSLQEYLINFIEKSDCVEEFLKISQFKRLKAISGVELTVGSEDVYYYNLLFLEKLFRYILRLKKLEEGGRKA